MMRRTESYYYLFSALDKAKETAELAKQAEQFIVSPASSTSSGSSPTSTASPKVITQTQTYSAGTPDEYTVETYLKLRS